MTLITIIEIGLAGSIGALLRFTITRIGNEVFKAVPLPMATLLINLLGAFCLGMLTARFPATSLMWLVGSGLLGGFTTFSTFTNEVVVLIRDRPLLATGYLVLSAVLGVAVAYGGFLLL